MGLFDKLKNIVKKDDDNFVDLNKEIGKTGSPGPAGLLDQEPEPTKSPETAGLAGLPGAPIEPTPAAATPSSELEKEQIEIIRKDIEVLSSKIDALRAEIGNLDQRLANIESSLRMSAEKKGYY